MGVNPKPRGDLRLPGTWEGSVVMFNVTKLKGVGRYLICKKPQLLVWTLIIVT